MADGIGTDAFEPENDLEIELVRATHEPAFRDAFLRQLLDSEVFLALLPEGPIEVGPDGQPAVSPDMKLQLGAVERDGQRLFPFFSAALRAQAHYRQDHFIATDKVRDLFLRHPDTEFVLNPGSDYGLGLTRRDIDGLLRGDLTAH